MHALPNMVIPSQKRPRIFRGGVLQIMVTRSCDLSCFGCSAGSNLISKPATMDPDQFREAVRSLAGYFGVYGIFGGNPCTSPHFADYCRVLKEENVPWEQRGIWTNNPMKHGRLCAVTFNPSVSNINVHLNTKAYETFQRDWPEALTAREEHTTLGLTTDSQHGSPWVAMKDEDRLVFPDGSVHENTEENRWKLIKNCPINKHWSAIIALVDGKLRAFGCEIMGHMAALHVGNEDWGGTHKPFPDLGLPVEPGWWKRPLADFDSQFRTCCHACGVAMNRPGQLAIGGAQEEFSKTHAYIARPKVRDRQVVFIESESLGRRTRPATEYLDGVTPKVPANA